MTEKKPVRIEFNRNNLHESASPYLLQHADNPVWWQEWKPEVLACAVRENKPLLVSSGYSTCHWCHVMAAGAFSDPVTAAFLNENFVCIKIDREQRPDIDQFMMEFILSQNGTGGWPLNLFMTPGSRPVFALMFAPAVSSGGRLSFLEVAKQVLHYFNLYGQSVPAFTPEVKMPGLFPENNLIPELLTYYDDVHRGFGQGQKFPPHTTMLFLLYHFSFEPDTRIKSIITGTLDAMRLRGLNNHLQGGVFRYCVDRAWTIPHFEKMLYDQALALWCYSLAWKVMGVPAYKTMAEKILQCLGECFEKDGLYITAFNADTNHEEGATYLWSHEELSDILTPEEFKSLCEVYVISPEGNLDGKIHLVRKNDLPLDEVENKLLAVRKMRPQPSKDDKILCGVNALTAIALIHAGRYLDKPELETNAALLVHRLLDIFRDGPTLWHSLWAGSLQKQGFLSDAGAMLLAVTLLYENDVSWLETMSAMAEYVGSFRENGKWIESRPVDFQTIEASWSDHPAPSGISVAETGLTRAALLTGSEPGPADFRQPFFCDFFNINVMLRNGMFHLYTSREHIPWRLIPANSLQKRGKPETDCYKAVCSPLDR